MTPTHQRQARYYGSCPLSPGTRLTVTKWYESTAGHLVFLEFKDQHGVDWIGPEYPRGFAPAVPMEIQTDHQEFSVISTIIDANKNQTDFAVE